MFSCLHKARNGDTYLWSWRGYWVMPIGALSILSSIYLILGVIIMITVTTLFPWGHWWILWHTSSSSKFLCIQAWLYLHRQLLFKTRMQIETVKAFCDVSSHWPSTFEFSYQFWLLIKNDPIWMLQFHRSLWNLILWWSFKPSEHARILLYCIAAI